MNNIDFIVQAIRESVFSDSISVSIAKNEDKCAEILITEQIDFIDFFRFLKKDSRLNFDMLIDVCGVDNLGTEPRFEVVYHLLSMKNNARCRVKIRTNESVDSLNEVYLASDWYEREVFDMFGISFTGNLNMRRILTDYGFEGHPLRKDFPLSGYVQVKYDHESESVVTEPVTLMQDYREFDFSMPWKDVSIMNISDKK